MGWLAWIIFGAIAGWVASIIAGTNARQGCLLNIIVGIAGAFIGGFLYGLFTGRPFDFNFNISSFIVAVIGAVILLFILTGLRGGGASSEQIGALVAKVYHFPDPPQTLLALFL